jgi:hypothetical protein
MQENIATEIFYATTFSVKHDLNTGLKGTALLKAFVLRSAFLLATLLFALPTGNGRAADDGLPPTVSDVASSPSCASCQEFDRLNSLIRDGKVPKETARTEVPVLLHRIKEWYDLVGGNSFERTDWVFPLKGYMAPAVGGGRTHGYLPIGYNYYDGNRHGGHPSLDIFIHDRNQDDRDDRTGTYVAVLSVSGGIVVARETEWREGSTLRGGKYLWIYDPSTDHLFYYAHLREITVSVGTIVAPGDTLGFVGRTGLNAHKKRSPTHLHLTCLSTSRSSLLPEYIYPDLVRTRSIK